MYLLLHSLGLIGLLAELALAIWLIIRLRRVARVVRRRRADGHGLTAALDAGLIGMVRFRALASGLAMEVSAFTLALTGWFRRAPAGFSMHRRSSYVAVVGVLLFLAAVESAAAHLLLATWVSPIAAWVATGLAIYGVTWLLGDTHAVRLSPLRFAPAGLIIEKGVRWHLVVPREDIAAATPIEGPVAGALDLSLLGPNLLLTLHRPAQARGPFGITRSATQVALSVDDRAAFTAACSSRAA
jgi:hypothetical protein